jgi:hypothetical protein
MREKSSLDVIVGGAQIAGVLLSVVATFTFLGLLAVGVLR